MADKPKILVTGANGQSGKELKDLSDSFPQFDFVYLSRADMPVHHFELVRNFFKTLKPAYCINCAGYTAVDRAEEEKDKAFQVNAEAVGVLAAICKEKGTKLVHISTDYIFDGHATIPYQEDSATKPQCVYGASKLEGEKQAMALNPEVIIIRTSWMYSSYGKNFVKTILQLLKGKNEISVVEDQVGSPTYAADLAETILQIIDSNEKNTRNWTPGIYHYRNNGVMSWFDFANAIKEIRGSSCTIKPVTTAEYPMAAKRPAYSVLDTSKIQQVFNIRMKDWKTSLQTCINKI
ncbi:MAG TPA: dTDP-4-dehydrorhamnose reductase [Chitinophagaceae bacterium]|nr:dTDP-4-dehydrorhamnose reductase [Chitinophagaceae bacterium]